MRKPTLYAVVAVVICSVSGVRAADCIDPKSIAEFRGNGTTNTRPFETEGPWELIWSSDRFVAITLRKADQTGEFKLVRGVGSKGGGSSFFPVAGRFYLEIDTGNSWIVSIHRVTQDR